VIAERKQHACNGADAVRTFYALYYPKDSEKFKKYYKFGQTKDNGFIFMPRYSTSSRVLFLNDKIVDAEVAASDPAIKNYFLDNYIGNSKQPTNTLFASWRHQFYGYTADEIKNAKFSNGLEQTFFGTVQVGADVITIVYTGGLATVPAAYSAIDGVSSIAGGISQMVNAGNNKGETWNFKRNFYNFLGKENGDKLYKADQVISGVIGLAGLASMKFGKISIKNNMSNIHKTWINHIDGVVDDIVKSGRRKVMVLGEGGQKYIRSYVNRESSKMTEFIEMRPDSLNYTGKKCTPEMDAETLDFNLLLIRPLQQKGFSFKVVGVKSSASAGSPWLKKELEVLEELNVKWDVIPRSEFDQVIKTKTKWRKK